MLQTIISSESYIILAVVTLLALVALIYLLSPPMNLLEDISARGAQIRERMRGLLVGQYPSDLKTRLLAAYVDVALEHHEAIWRLREFNLNGSALALVRSVFFDAMVRGWWINKVATNEQIEQASRDEVKTFPRMV